MKLNKQNKKGFTIVELVIVIAVIGILSAILIPTFANLTTQAQEAAAKQQVADAYTAYLVEASNGKFDTTVYQHKTAGDGAEYIERAASIQNKSQAQVALKLNSTWYTYDAEKGWGKATSDPTAPTPVVALSTVTTGYTGAYLKNNTTYTAVAGADEAAQLKTLSTFNGVEVYSL